MPHLPKWFSASTTIPIQQLKSDGVSVVVGNQVDSLVAEPQVSHQGLHHTGLFKNGVLVRSLGWQNVERKRNIRNTDQPYQTQALWLPLK